MNITIKFAIVSLFSCALPLIAATPEVAALRNSAQTALTSNNFVEAERYYRQLTQETPDDPDAWHGLANSLDAMGRTKEADPIYLQAAKLYKKQYENDPTDSMSLYNLALSTMSGGDGDTARKYIEEGVTKFPDDKNLIRLNELFNAGIPSK